MILLGNKKDLEEERKVQTWELSELAKERKCEYFETSAKENINIDDAFGYLINEIIKKCCNTNNGFSILSNNNSNKGSCCGKGK